ncbi:hypothetical protein QE152_g33698 [Popillia japonica]|uniref:Uncharacterized protein n=1 Tax=Popillia japonica TaxID=7064 RepID=A0AAW1IVZ6_POPJA
MGCASNQHVRVAKKTRPTRRLLSLWQECEADEPFIDEANSEEEDEIDHVRCNSDYSDQKQEGSVEEEGQMREQLGRQEGPLQQNGGSLRGRVESGGDAGKCRETHDLLVSFPVVQRQPERLDTSHQVQ